MLCPEYYQVRLSEFDGWVFQALVPPDHYLRQALQLIPWDSFYDIVAPYYRPDEGRPAESPLLMLKLEFLRYQYNLSDREVIRRAETDVAFRYFLQIRAGYRLPNPSLLPKFRGRLGREGFRKVFRHLVRTAREYGLVKDRLRVKDASHVIASIAVPSALSLIAQMRDKLLVAAESFDPVRVEGERVNIELFTEINVLSAGGDEAVDAVQLVRQEEEAHGNDIEALSMDGAGFNGPMLRELEDPEGLAVDTYAPPKKEKPSTTFTPDDFVEENVKRMVRLLCAPTAALECES